MTFVPNAEDFSLQYDETNKFSFFESEDGEIFSYGHRDPIDIVSEVKLYALVMGDFLSDEDADELIQYVKHTWAKILPGMTRDDEWRFQFGDKYESEEEAFPLTVIDRG